eukprot:8258491-Ditylum_brightwellii.AAC.1
MQYQPGGTSTFITDKWMSQVCGSGWDKFGRWSYITIKGKKNPRVTIISAYQVCENSIATAGLTTC